MKKKLLIVIGLLPLLAAAFLILIFGIDKVRDSMMIKRGDAIVAKLDAYRTPNGHPPAHLDEIGLPETESGPFYYSRENGEYSLWYGKSLGESMFYYSRSKKWSEEGL